MPAAGLSRVLLSRFGGRRTHSPLSEHLPIRPGEIAAVPTSARRIRREPRRARWQGDPTISTSAWSRVVGWGWRRRCPSTPRQRLTAPGGGEAAAVAPGYCGPMNPCPICGNQARFADVSGADAATVSCPRCGSYRMGVVMPALLNALPMRSKLGLSFAIRRAADRKDPPPRLYKNTYEAIIASSVVPESVPLQRDALVLAIAERAPYMGDQASGDTALVWAARLGLPSAEHAVELASNTGPEALIRHYARQGDVVSFGLTPAGWERVEQLRRAQPDSDQIFVAMWFDSSMGPIWETGLAPAITSVGLSPYRVDQDPGHDRVDDKIMAQIRRSRALVADLTGLRGGVYFEAGFAMGLGLPVVFTCSESWVDERGEQWFKGVHFDVNHYPFIRWRDAAHLRQQLTWRLAASGIGRRVPEPEPEPES